MTTREQWLIDAVEALTPLMKDENYQVPPIRVSTGFPSKGGLSTKKRTIGQCWSSAASSDGVPHIFISPVLDDTVDVLSTLLHEMIHATVGTEEGHKGAFVDAAKAVGFVGPWTQTPVGEDLIPHLTKIADSLGEYPHSKLDPALSPIKKQTTRQLLVKCVESDYKVRMTRKWLDEVGPPLVPLPQRGDGGGDQVSNYKVGDRVRITNIPNGDGGLARNGDTGRISRLLDQKEPYSANGLYSYQVEIDRGPRLFFKASEVELLRSRGYVITRGELEDLLAWDDRDEREKIVDSIIRGEDTP